MGLQTRYQNRCRPPRFSCRSTNSAIFHGTSLPSRSPRRRSSRATSAETSSFPGIEAKDADRVRAAGPGSRSPDRSHQRWFRTRRGRVGLNRRPPGRRFDLRPSARSRGSSRIYASPTPARGVILRLGFTKPVASLCAALFGQGRARRRSCRVRPGDVQPSG